MPCKACGSPNHSTFSAEMNIHLRGVEGLDKPTVWIFPELLVCLDCGFAQCLIPETELPKLARGSPA
jgi:hypothetical protein